MKKILVILLTMLSGMAAWSQDTTGSFIRDGYYYNRLPDLKKDYYSEWVVNTGHKNGIQAKMMRVEGKALTVYGVAATMMTTLDLFWMQLPPDSVIAAEGIDVEEWMQAGVFGLCRDTSTANLYEYLGLYLPNADSIIAQRQVMVHRRNDTPAYYYETDIRDSWGRAEVYPMYEKYFDSGIVVTDTFYMGVTQLSMEQTLGAQSGMAFGLRAIQGLACGWFCENHIYRFNPELQYPGYVEWMTDCTHSYYMIFPILTPDPNNPEDPDNPGDTTAAINGSDMVARYVTVQPNPAVEEARVLSSFGLERIEAYDDRGRQVAEFAAKGYEATLDIKAWPRGTYLLRITTPMGTVTKKLLVQ